MEVKSIPSLLCAGDTIWNTVRRTQDGKSELVLDTVCPV